MSEERKAQLAMTAADHAAVQSGAPSVLEENPGKTLLETMDEEGLRGYIRAAIDGVRWAHTQVTGPDPEKRWLLGLLLNQYLLPDMEYLRSLGRLPEEFKDLDPKKEFALPADQPK